VSLTTCVAKRDTTKTLVKDEKRMSERGEFQMQPQPRQQLARRKGRGGCAVGIQGERGVVTVMVKGNT
jgi:hypothetical protein